MKSILSILLLTPVLLYGQVLTEDQIPFTLNSDNDSEVNVVDEDDDNDGTPDNSDIFPLDANLNGPVMQTQTIPVAADASIRNNSNSAANSNYGTDPTAQTKNSNRSFILKFSQPTNAEITMATLTLFGDSEDDPLDVYFLPYNSWDEATVTYNNTDLTGMFPIGTTGPPVNGEYTFEIPLFALPTDGSDFSLFINDPSDPNGQTESVFMKETVGSASSIQYEYDVPITPRLVVDQSPGTNTYVNGGVTEINVKLAQMPTSDVWVPFALSNGLSTFTTDEVLTFDATNWDVFQTIQIDPVAIGTYDVYVRPLHSADPYYNGHNPEDLPGYVNQSLDITNLSGWTVAPCNTFTIDLTVDGANPDEELDYRVMDAPAGLNVVEHTGKVSFTPLSHQIASSYPVTIELTNEAGEISVFTTNITVDPGVPCDPVGVYVDLDAEDSMTEDGSPSDPYHELVPAIDDAIANNIEHVYIRGGEYQFSSIVSISASAPSTNRIVVQPAPGEHVKINFDLMNAFKFEVGSKNIELRGLEIDGNTDEIDFWCIVAQSVYGDESIPRGGGIAVNVDGDSITVRNCYIHDAYQKAVEIRNGRYLDVTGNIIHHIATSSISGGHGIMRQQAGDEITEPDNLNDYRWDLNGNLIYNVEQRIYSWVPLKEFMEMVLDEGKPILIDDPKDTDGIMDVMKARITNNVVAYGSIDHIRLKSTPNLEVSNNSIYAESTHADGITDKGGDTPTPQFINFICTNNAVQTNPVKTGIEIDDAIAQSDPGANPGSTAAVVSGNYVAGGTVKPVAYPGLNTVATTQLFVDANGGDFTINPALGLPASVGIDPVVLAELEARADDFGVTVEWDGWVNDDLLLSQTMLDNIPNVYDGIAGNELVFTDFGHFNADTTHIDFTVVDGAWKADKNVVSFDHEFRLNEQYSEWMRETLAHYKDQNGQDYARARWGHSHVKQDYIFENDWLVVSTISADTNTVILGKDVDFTIDGGLLVDFGSVTPAQGAYYDLMIAGNITAANTGDLFDYVQFHGYTPTDYTITIVPHPMGQAVRLTIGESCDLVVTTTNDDGPGSLRAAIACAVDGDVITFDAALAGSTIVLTSVPLIIDKSITIRSDIAVAVSNMTAGTLSTATGKAISLESFTIISDIFVNNATLSCLNMDFESEGGTTPIDFQNTSSASLTVNGVVQVR